MKQKYTRYGGKKACKYATKTRQCPTLKIRQSTGFSSCDPDATRTHDRLLRRQIPQIIGSSISADSIGKNL